MKTAFGLIPAEILIDRRRKAMLGIRLPKGHVELPERGPWRPWQGMLASTAAHAVFLGLAAGLMGGAAGSMGEQQTLPNPLDPNREISMVYLEPPPAQVAEPAPTPAPEQQNPVETNPPSQPELPAPGPTPDQVLSPAPAAETDLDRPKPPAPSENPEGESLAAMSDVPPNVISTQALAEAGPDALETSPPGGRAGDPSMEDEAQRIFGREPTGTGTRHNALPWASDSLCVPDPTPIDANSSVVLDSINGQVFDRRGAPLPGAHLQVVGTSYRTLSDNSGYYTLVFDVSLVANCRVQVVRVSAGGYRGRDLYLAMGQGNNDVWLNRR